MEFKTKKMKKIILAFLLLVTLSCSAQQAYIMQWNPYNASGTFTSGSVTQGKIGSIQVYTQGGFTGTSGTVVLQGSIDGVIWSTREKRILKWTQFQL